MSNVHETDLFDEDRDLLFEDIRDQEEERGDALPEEPYDEDAWRDRDAEREHRHWVASFLWADPPDPDARVVALHGSLVAVYECGEWRVEDSSTGRTTYPSFKFSPAGYSDRQLVKKLQIYILFS